MNHTWVLRTPGDAAAYSSEGCERLPFAQGVFRTRRARAWIESSVLEAPAPFDDVVGSWNADLPPGSRLGLEVQVRQEAAWSSWYSLGTALGLPARRLELRSPGPQEDAQGLVAADTLKLKSPACALRYRLRLLAAPGRPVVLRQAALTVSAPGAPAEPPPFHAGPWIRRLKVRGRSQFTAPEAYRHDICSPTSLSTVLEYWGVLRKTVDMAERVRDRSTGDFGNWTFNMAAAGALGLDGLVARLDSLDDLAAEIASGRPVVVSLTFGPGELPRAPIRQTKGHLMVVTGFTRSGDVIVMDPAGRTARRTSRVYGRREFHRAWRVNKRGLTYLVSPRVRRRCLTVGVPAADLWDAPQPRRTSGLDLLALDHHSQLIYGERITVLAAEGAWVKVQAEEPAHPGRKGRWLGCTGWMRAAELTAAAPVSADAVVRTRQAILKTPAGLLTLSVGTRLRRLGEAGGAARVRLLDGSTADVATDALAAAPIPAGQARRPLILQTAELFLGTRYYWGGRSGVQEEPSIGVDCSGLACLAYRVCGLDLPHNAHEQRLRSKAVTRRGLRPGDLVFLSAGADSRKITHVLIYTGGDGLIEARWTAGRVLRCTFAERFGMPLSALESGRLVKDITFPRPRRRRVFFGSYF
ncbi:MAG: C39 family peptidase [Elusimicrobia bacterium]|nr:C39 family peptidase [Elusimicrobiota bacterium]